MRFSIKRLAFPYWRTTLVIAAIFLVGGYFYFTSGNGRGATLTVVPGDFAQQVSIAGTVVAAQDVDLGFAANGRVSGTYVSVGQRVGAGAVLAEVENGDLIAAVSQKKAALAQAQADLASLLAGTRPEQIAVTEASVVSAQNALLAATESAYTAADDAVHNRADVIFTNPRSQPQLAISVPDGTLKNRLENERTTLEPVLVAWGTEVTKLTTANIERGAQNAQNYLTQVAAFLSDANTAVNQAVPDQSTSAATLSADATSIATGRTNVNAAATTLSSDLSALISAEKSLTLEQAGATSDAVAAQEAAVQVAQADVQNAQAALRKTQVVAPFFGVVTRMDAKVGEIVSPATSDISMQSDGLFQIETYIPELSIAGVAVGNLATTTLDPYGSSVPFASKVISVDPAETVKDGVPTYKTTLTFISPDPRIRSGMTANVSITIAMLHHVIVIPSGAVARDASGATYVSVMEGKKAVHRPVTTGVTPSLGQVEITSGLSDGDVIYLTPS